MITMLYGIPYNTIYGSIWYIVLLYSSSIGHRKSVGAMFDFLLAILAFLHSIELDII